MEDSTIITMTKAEAKPERKQLVQQALQDVAKAARGQSGCVAYRIFRSAENPAVTINFEQWATKEERDTFLGSTAVKEFASTVSDAFVEPPQPMTYEMLNGA